MTNTPKLSDLRTEIKSRARKIKAQCLAYGWSYTMKDLYRIAVKELWQDMNWNN